jgi:hypothetical protein
MNDCRTIADTKLYWYGVISYVDAHFYKLVLDLVQYTLFYLSGKSNPEAGGEALLPHGPDGTPASSAYLFGGGRGDDVTGSKPLLECCAPHSHCTFLFMHLRSLLLPSFIALCAYLACSSPFHINYTKVLIAYLRQIGFSTMGSTHESGEMAQWVKEQFEGLFGRPERDGESFQKTFANSFAHFPKITYNDKQIDLGEFKEQLETSRFAVQQVEIEWPQISEHPAQDKVSLSHCSVEMRCST